MHLAKKMSQISKKWCPLGTKVKNVPTSLGYCLRAFPGIWVPWDPFLMFARQGAGVFLLYGLYPVIGGCTVACSIIYSLLKRKGIKGNQSFVSPIFFGPSELGTILKRRYPKGTHPYHLLKFQELC